MRLCTAVLLVAIVMLNFPIKGLSAELLMLEQQGCEWCERWHEEIGEIYPKTSEGKLAPLRIIDIADPWPDELESINSDHFTPTFIVMDNKVEVGRLRGYPGDEFFWFLLNEILVKLDTNVD